MELVRGLQLESSHAGGKGLVVKSRDNMMQLHKSSHGVWGNWKT